MPVYKDDGNGTFYVQCYYRDARGSKRHKTKRGFSSEVEAAVWEGQFKSLNGGAMDMTFSEFVEVYASEVKPRIREHTWITKEYIINDKLVPFFGDMRMCDVRPIDVIRWQNELTEHRDADGKPWAPTYLRTVNNQLNAIFNHAERYYGLADNPVRRVDKIGSKKGGEMQFWTKDEYLRFSEAVMDKPLSFHAFELLYWTGIRCGELLALTPSDFMLDSSRLRINKSYQSLHGVDTVTDPKTPKSVRTIVMPAFLRDEMADFIEMRDDVAPDERLFAVTKHFLAHEMERGCKASGVKRIRIHDIRHSHVSLLIEMGFSALAIAERMGHEAVDITYRYAHLFLLCNGLVLLKTYLLTVIMLAHRPRVSMSPYLFHPLAIVAVVTSKPLATSHAELNNNCKLKLQIRPTRLFYKTHCLGGFGSLCDKGLA